MNVLITSVGRRNYIVDYFKAAVGSEGRIIAVNSVLDTAGMMAADKTYVAPPVSSPNYIPFLLNVCRKETISVLLSLFDQDLSELAKNRQSFEEIGVCLIVPDGQIVNLCFDKLLTAAFLCRIGIKTPITVDTLRQSLDGIKAGRLSFPLIVKPRWGTGSLSSEMVHGAGELRFFHRFLARNLANSYLSCAGADKANRLIVQQVIRGDEYGLDVVNDLRGNFVTCFVRKKMGMRAGETDTAVSVKDHDLFAVGKTIGTALKHISILDVDLIVDSQGTPYVIDLNPRFGGGYPFSHVAGANVPAALLSWCEGREPDRRWLRTRPGIVATKGLTLLTKGRNNGK
jgi:carbamoyl-phosphate synthase large subunit